MTSRRISFCLRAESNAPQGRVEYTAKVRYQTCDDKMCLPPVRHSHPSR
jgi:hypothetical protein